MMRSGPYVADTQNTQRQLRAFCACDDGMSTDLVRRVEDPVTKEDGAQGFGLLLYPFFGCAKVELRVVVVIFRPI